MINIRYSKILLFFYMVSIHLQGSSADILHGNAENNTESFTFSLQQYIQNVAATNFYVGAQPGQEGTTKEFALARISRGEKQFQGLTPEKISFNGTVNCENPLFNQAITSLTLLESANRGLTGIDEFPVVTIPTQPDSVYFFVDSLNPKRISLRSVSQIPDATGATTSGIINLAADESQVFAAVKPHNGEFGDNNSGITLIMHGFFDIEEEGQTKTVRKFIIIDAPTGQRTEHPRAVRLDKTSSVVAIENDLSVMENVVSMHWDKFLKRLFIAVQVQAGNNINDGARAIVTGHLSGDKLLLTPIASSAVFEGENNKIVGARGSNAPVSIHKINTLFTSTALHYLIVLGGNGTPNQTNQTVFALPLVNSDNEDDIGTIASKNAQPEDKFSIGDVERLINRQLTKPASQPDEMVTAIDPAAQVGGGPLEENIQDIFIRADTIFAMVSTPEEEKKAGIYYSQALFNANGTIKGWTNWERAAGTTNHVFGAVLDPFNANFTFMTGENNNNVTIVKQTLWSNGNENGLLELTKILNSTYPKNIGGIQNFLNFVPETPGLANISLLVSTGLNKVSLIETGQRMGEIIIPRAGNEFDTTVEFENGTITQNIMNTAVVTISGGVLDNIGAVTTAEIARNGENGNQGWLFVGGINGLAVLSDDTGNGWNPNNAELGPGLQGLTEGMSFKLVGNYSFIRRIINDTNFLYILTDAQLDRIDLTQGNIGLNQIEPTTIATSATLLSNSQRAFTDCVISNSFALIGTGIGLFRIGNGKNITEATNSLSAEWTSVPLPEGVCAVTQLIPISKTGRSQDLTRNQGGQIYVLDAYQGKNKSRIHRFSIQEIINNNPVEANTITLFNDLYIKDVPSFLLNFGIFKQNFTTDGALYFATEDQNLTNPVLVTLTPEKIPPRTGVLFVGVNSTGVPITLSGASYISSLLRNIASGSFLITGDFNIQVNE
ncbi:MAG: hypothetical protein WCD44_02265 [Candidatus Babeliales bacterium]